MNICHLQQFVIVDEYGRARCRCWSTDIDMTKQLPAFWSLWEVRHYWYSYTAITDRDEIALWEWYLELPPIGAIANLNYLRP